MAEVTASGHNGLNWWRKLSDGAHEISDDGINWFDALDKEGVSLVGHAKRVALTEVQRAETGIEGVEKAIIATPLWLLVIAAGSGGALVAGAYILLHGLHLAGM